MENLRTWIDGFEDYLDTQTFGETLAANQVKNIRRTIYAVC